MRPICSALVLCTLISCSPSSDEAPATPVAEPAPEAAIAPPPPPQWEDVLRAALTTFAPPSDAELVAALTGDIDPTTDPAFTTIPVGLASRENMYGRTMAIVALSRMQEAAAADGVDLVAISAFRSMRDQSRIWNNKWTGVTLVEGGALPDTVPDPADRARKILEYSSMPTTSRHHWGTDFDLNNLNNSWFDTPEGAATYAWLDANAAQFGFCQVYSEKGVARPAGYEMEKWHWSYMPLASKFLAAYPALISYSTLTGFEGAETARDIQVIENYVEGIAPECQANWPAN